MTQERFEELLPWYVNGTLEAEDRAWVEQYMKDHPEVRAELEWFGSLQRRMHENAPMVPATIGLARTMHLIRGDRPTIAERISAFFGGFALRPAYALAGVAALAIQGGVILNLLGDAKDDASEIRTLRASQVTEAPMLKVNFAPDAKEADIRHLLMSVQGSVAGGPGQLGDYYIRVPGDQLDAAASRLKADPIVQAVAVAPGLPPRE
jgi:hypothetical protein